MIYEIPPADADAINAAMPTGWRIDYFGEDGTTRYVSDSASAQHPDYVSISTVALGLAETGDPIENKAAAWADYLSGLPRTSSLSEADRKRTSGEQPVLTSSSLAVERFIPEGVRLPALSVDYGRGLTIRLHKARRFQHGHLVEVVHYAEFDGETYDDPVVRESFAYTDGPLGPKSRIMSIEWFTESGDVGASKTRPKHYTDTESVQAGKRQRANVIDSLQALVGKLSLTTGGDTTLDEGRSFLEALTPVIAGWKEAAGTALYDAILAAPDDVDFLDKDLGGGVTPRVVILNELSPWSGV